MASGSKSRNSLIVPGSAPALHQMKYEIAAELGLPVGKQLAAYADTEFASELGTIPGSQIREDYWGHITSRDTGAVGGTITQRLIRQAQQGL